MMKSSFVILLLSLFVTVAVTASTLREMALKNPYLNAASVSKSVQQSTTCRFSDMDKAVKDFYAATAALDTADAFNKLNEVGTIYANIFETINPCFLSINNIANDTVTVNATAVTDACTQDVGTPEFNSDPCCATGSGQSACCVPRTVTYGRPELGNINDNNSCSTKPKVYAMFRYFMRAFADDQNQCNSIFKKRTKFLSGAMGRMFKCVTDFLAEGADKNCDKDSDCSSGTCRQDNKKCLYTGGEINPNNSALGRCIVNAVSMPIARTVAAHFNFTGGIDIASFSAAVQNAISTDSCIDLLTLNPQTQYTTKATCEAQQKCTDNQNTCSSSSNFCGAGCFNGICSFDISTPFPDWYNSSSLCNAAGTCFSNQYIGYMNQSSCQAVSFCEGQESATSKTQCEQGGECIGFPETFNAKFKGVTSICVIPETVQDGYTVCTTTAPGAYQTEIGCVVPADTSVTATACSGWGGSMVTIPTTSSACLGYNKCFSDEEGIFSKKNQAECSKCSEKWQPLFSWRPFRWLPRFFVQSSQWIKREPKQIYKWTKRLDFQKFVDLINIAAGLQYGPMIRGFLECSTGPLLDVVLKFACDCGTTKGTNCFAKDPESTLSNFVAFSNATQNFTFSAGVTMTMLSNSIDPKLDGDNVKLSLKQSPVIAESGSASKSRRASQQAQSVLNVISSSGSVIGSVIGNGIRLSTGLRNSATLCLRQSLNIKAPSTGSFPKRAFAVKKSDGTFAVSTISTVESTSGSICGQVKDTEVYYPAAVSNSVGPNPGSTATRSTIALLAIIVAIIAGAFVILM